MYLSLGMMGGIGYGMVYQPSIVSVCQYFDKKRAMATGIAVSGTGIGVFIFGPLSNMLIDMYTWRGALLIEAALVLHCLPLGLLYRPLTQFAKWNRPEHLEKSYGATDGDIARQHVSEPENGLESDSVQLSKETLNLGDANSERSYIVSKDQKLSAMESFLVLSRHIVIDFLGLLLIIPFALFTMASFLFDLFYMLPNFYLPTRAVFAGIPKDKAAWLVSALGISSTLSRAGFGWLSDKHCVNKTMLCATALTVCGICTAVGPQFSSFEVLLAYAVLYGLTSGFIVSLSPVLLEDIVGIEKLAEAFGVWNMLLGIAELLGPPLAGWMYDITGGYFLTFMTGGAAITASGLIMYSTLCIQSNRRTVLENSSP